MHLSLQMEPLKHYGFLFSASILQAPNIKDTSGEGEQIVELTRKTANLQLTGKRRSQQHYQKSSLPTWGQVKALCIERDINFLMTMLLNRLGDCNRLIHSSEGRTLILGFKSLSVCIGHQNIWIPINGNYGLRFYKILEQNHMGLFASQSLEFSVQ